MYSLQEIPPSSSRLAMGTVCLPPAMACCVSSILPPLNWCTSSLLPYPSHQRMCSTLTEFRWEFLIKIFIVTKWPSILCPPLLSAMRITLWLEIVLMLITCKVFVFPSSTCVHVLVVLFSVLPLDSQLVSGRSVMIDL